MGRLTHTDAFLGMLRTVGLDLADARVVHGDLALRVFGFVLFVDYRQDQGTCHWNAVASITQMARKAQ
ncbi:hypothetical protein [Nonomuraea longispora]|uniref:hypothetical protein n=1 Tax=Nonomuraea longispora TaxID=1848320 RepID=UPI0015F2D4DB|nr:hypothetical protein [Nonomuraea longispora]